jgi:hypothetical protein
MSLVTLEEYKTRTNISIGGDDQIILRLLAQAEARVAEFCDRTLEDSGSDITEVLDGSGTRVLQLDAWPIVSVTSVKYLDSVSSGAATYTAFDASTYFQIASRGQLIRSGYVDFGFANDEGCWPEGEGNVEVVYRGGWTNQNAPKPLILGIYSLTDLLWHERSGNTEALVGGDLQVWLESHVGPYRRTAP